MMSYKEFKAKLKEKKQPIVLGVCFVLVFIVGFGTGSFEKELDKTSTAGQKYYNTKVQGQAQGPAGEVKGATTGEQPVQATSSVAEAVAGNCIVKGNLSSGGKKIYHVKGGAFYGIVKPEQCFNTEKQAQDAGFIKSSR